MKPMPSILSHVGRRHFLNRHCALFLATLAMAVPDTSHASAATNAAASNRPPPLVVVVLPFANATGNPAMDDWQQALPALVRSCLRSAECASVPGWKKLEPSLTKAGWTDAKAVDPEWARQVARDVKAGFALWGSFQLQPDGWAVTAKLLQTEVEASPEEFRLSGSDPVKLAESLALRLVARWERPVSEAQQAHWRMMVTETDAAAGTLAHALAVDLRQAPAPEQEQAWREVLASDPGCGMAYSALINLLADDQRNEDLETLVGQWVGQQPDSCLAHSAKGLELWIEGDLAGAEAALHEALRLHPGCSAAVRAAFDMYASSERWPALAAILKDAHARRPEAEFIQILLADALAQTGDRAGARVLLDSFEELPEEEELRKVQASGAETWDVHFAAAELEIAHERWWPALAELQRAVALNPSNALVHFHLSGVYDALKDEHNAEAHMRRALELDRGEFGEDLLRQTALGFKVMNAFSEAQSGAPGVLETMQRRAEAGDLPAQMAMAKACFAARPPRTEEGMRWHLLAAEQGEDQAQYGYARNLLALRGKAAIPEALSWLNKSAAQGNDDAQYRLGLILYEGKLLPRDTVTAAQWVYLAADQKHVEARRLLKELQLFLTAEEMAEARKRAEDFQPVKRARSMPEQ